MITRQRESVYTEKPVALNYEFVGSKRIKFHISKAFNMPVNLKKND